MKRIGSRLLLGMTCSAITAVLCSCGGSAAPGGASTAAGGSSPPSPAGAQAGAPSLTACAGLTQADAATITGDPTITRSANTQAAAAGVCIYTDSGQPAIAGGSVTVQSISLPGISSRVVQSELARNSTGANLQPVPGIGDFAYAGTSSGGALLAFAKGNRLVTIAVLSNSRSSQDVLASLETVARRMAI
jgi:hypothetical protein